MDKKQAYTFLNEVYQEIIIGMKIDKIPFYFSNQYIQTTDGVSSNIIEFTNHISALNRAVKAITISPFYDFLFDKNKQTATLRYVVSVNKTNGENGNIEMIAIFELDNNKIVRCNEQSCPLNSNEEFNNLARIN